MVMWHYMNARRQAGETTTLHDSQGLWQQRELESLAVNRLQSFVFIFLLWHPHLLECVEAGENRTATTTIQHVLSTENHSLMVIKSTAIWIQLQQFRSTLKTYLFHCNCNTMCTNNVHKKFKIWASVNSHQKMFKIMHFVRKIQIYHVCVLRT